MPKTDSRIDSLPTFIQASIPTIRSQKI